MLGLIAAGILGTAVVLKKQEEKKSRELAVKIARRTMKEFGAQRKKKLTTKK